MALRRAQELTWRFGVYPRNLTDPKARRCSRSSQAPTRRLRLESLENWRQTSPGRFR